MSGERKSITIDSASLIGGSGGGTSKRRSKRSGSGERKIRPSSIVQPSTLKKTLLERIKQHQRTRERSKRHEDGRQDNKTSSEGGDPEVTKGDNNFTQSMDFLRKLALKRREQQQHTQKQRRNDIIGGLEAKTPEAKILNQVSETLQNGEILTNTGLLGLPVVPMLSTTPNAIRPSVVSAEPMIQLGEIPIQPMTQPIMQPIMQPITTLPTIENPPKITDLAEMYNNTIASASNDASNDTSSTDTPKEPSLHIPKKPEDYLPSIYIKEEPPHGCLKNGNKPTFREWATKMLHKPVDTLKTILGDSSENNSTTENKIQAVGGSGISNSSGIDNNDNLNNNSIDPSQIAGMRVKIRKTKKKRFRIGKHDDVVGVLLKNKQTQRHIQSQHLTLKQKTIGDIRKYLYDHHLLKIGSNAPPDVLRRMYEDAILTGEVKNTNKDVLLHNFMSGGGGNE
jgi:hypothetical protein